MPRRNTFHFRHRTGANAGNLAVWQRRVPKTRPRNQDPIYSFLGQVFETAPAAVKSPRQGYAKKPSPNRPIGRSSEVDLACRGRCPQLPPALSLDGFSPTAHSQIGVYGSQGVRPTPSRRARAAEAPGGADPLWPCDYYDLLSGSFLKKNHPSPTGGVRPIPSRRV